MRPIARHLAAIAAIGAFATPAMAQQPPACADDAYRQFDYWLGDWSVTNPAGAVVGANTITSVSAGCGLLEEWTASSGGTGVSISFYNPRTESWTQQWVGAGGSILRLEGGLVDGAMQLQGERKNAQGATIIDRVRWIPLEPGKVRQHWESSQDGGETWTTAFDGTYTRVR